MNTDETRSRFASLRVARPSEKIGHKDTGRKCPEATPKRVVEDIYARRRSERSLQPAAVAGDLRNGF